MKSLYDEAVKNLEEGNFEEAEKLFAEFLRENPKHAMALNKLGLVYAKQRMLIKAREYFERALSEDPTLIPALNNLGNISRVEGNLEEAVKHYKQAINLDPHNSTLHKNLAIVYKQMFRIGDYFRERRIAGHIEKLRGENKNLLREFFLLLRGKS